MSFITDNNNNTTDIEYTQMTYNDYKNTVGTSIYTYYPEIAGYYKSNFTDTEKDENNFCQFISPTETIKFTPDYDGRYVDIIWLYDETDAGYLEFTENDSFKFITKLNIQKWILVVNNQLFGYTPVENGITANQITDTLSEDFNIDNEYENINTVYITIFNHDFVFYDKNNDENSESPVFVTKIRPYVVMRDGDKLYLLNYKFGIYAAQTFNNPLSFQTLTGYNITVGFNIDNYPVIDHTIQFDERKIDFPTLNSNQRFDMNNGRVIFWNNYSANYQRIYSGYRTYRALFNVIAVLGIYFRIKNHDNLYLGYMDRSGQTTGEILTDNFESSYNYDKTNINNFNEYTPPVTPEASDTDNIDEINYGTQTSLNINQFISAYILDGVDLQNLSNEFKNPTNEIPTGDSPFENIISLKKYPFNVLNHTITFEPSNIILSKWDTNVSAAKINATQTLINIGSFTIDRKYNNFLDYGPYTTCEIYLPFADYVPINLNKCMGNTINIEMIWDIDGNIKYLILCDNLLIAEINANIASSQILTAINSGLKSLQDLQNTITIASGLTSVAGSAVAGSPVGIVSSAISTVSGVVNAVTNQNTNYSTQKGQSQSDVSQKTILDFVLHITRPIVKIPKNYASTVGYILNDTKVLSELSGFTVCDNVIINNINCLNNEKTEIKNLLETGVIL